MIDPKIEESTKLPARDCDPAHVARAFLSSGPVSLDGVPRLRRWRNSWYWWSRGGYRELPDYELEGWLVRFLNDLCVGVTRRFTGDVKAQVSALCMLPTLKEAPTWIESREDDWPASEIVATRSGIVHLGRFAAGEDDWHRPATPRLFTTTALDYGIEADSPAPDNWLEFLDSLWADDPESIDALQEIFGYLLAGSTNLQKIFLLIGPKRSGKGTIARVLRGLLGPANVAGPTLSSVATNFGLAPLLGKSLAVVGDARLSGKSDQSQAVERLLSISGEDALTVDRKFREPVTAKLGTRMMLLSNEVPRLADASGALASRFVMLRLSRSFFGSENPQLTEELLDELPGIFRWAAVGLVRLQARGRFAEPQSAKELHDELGDLASPVSAFVRDECATGPDESARVTELFAAWKAWCEEKGRHPGNEQVFGRDLRAAFPDVTTTRPRDQDGGRHRVYHGIGLNHY